MRALAIINPGNPTGQCLGEKDMIDIVKLCAKEGLVLLADEVYQENVYGDAPPFTSFRKALAEMPAKVAAKVQLVSFHSTSKGFIGERPRPRIRPRTRPLAPPR